MEIQQVVDQRKDMAGRTGHVFQIILLPFVGMSPHQQVYIPDDGRERGTDIVADRQHHLLPAMKQVFGILLGFLQLDTVIFTFGNIAGNHKNKDDQHNDRDNGNAGNRSGCLTQQLLFALHTFDRGVHLLLFYITQNLVDLTGHHTIIIAQVGRPVEQLFHQQLTLSGHTVLQAFQHTDDSVGRVVGRHQRIGHDLAGGIDNDTGICLARRKSIGQAAEESFRPFRRKNSVLLDNDMLFDLFLFDDRILFGYDLFYIDCIQVLHIGLFPGFEQAFRIQAFPPEQHIDRIDLQQLDGVGDQHPQGIHVAMCLVQRPVKMVHVVLGHADKLSHRLAFVKER